MKISLAFTCLSRGRHTCAQQKFAQIFDQISIANAALVRMVQKTLESVQGDLETRPMCRGNIGTQMFQQGFDFPPMYIATNRIMKNGTQLIIMLVAHDDSPFRST
jgi:hypothetical protein